MGQMIKKVKKSIVARRFFRKLTGLGASHLGILQFKSLQEFLILLLRVF